MENIFKNKKNIKIICIILLILIVILIYVYTNKEEIGANYINNTNNDFEELIENGSKEKNSNKNNSKKEDEYIKEEKINRIIVHITGEVRKKGVVELEEGNRIIDAINKAGGATEKADLESVNLATKVEDGMQIRIPSKEEKITLKDEIKSQNSEKNTKEINNKELIEKIDINTATKKEFEKLPGIGDEMASRIIEYRNKNGKFSKISDLKNIKGIGDSKFNNIKEYIMVSK